MKQDKKGKRDDHGKATCVSDGQNNNTNIRKYR